MKIVRTARKAYCPRGHEHRFGVHTPWWWIDWRIKRAGCLRPRDMAGAGVLNPDGQPERTRTGDGQRRGQPPTSRAPASAIPEGNRRDK